MGVDQAGLFLNSSAHGATSLGVPVGYAWDDQADFVEIPDAGKTGPSAQGLIRRRLIAEVEFLSAPGPIPIKTKASLVIVTAAKDGGTITFTMTNMIASTYASSSGGVPNRYRQQFIHEGDMDTDPLTIVEA